MTDPKIYLAIDNCFASKRWTKPADWASLIAELGIKYVECSADTECDPLYMGNAYQERWIEQTKIACENAGIQVANLYSGHGTYSTLGLAHWDAGVRCRFRDKWVKPQAVTAHALNAGLGFYTHAFDHSVLQSPDLYQKVLQTLTEHFAELASYAAEIDLKYISVEQMYTPHQIPWTIHGALSLLHDVFQTAHVPFYLTTDVGHMSGQQHFQMPTEQTLRCALQQLQVGKPLGRFWLGLDSSRALFDKAAAGELHPDAAIEQILQNATQTPYLFAQESDTSAYQWLKAVGCYSPIVHLQQNDGNSSPHWSFDPVHNAQGVIHADAVLKSLYESFCRPDDPSMPPKCRDVVLTLEPFISTAGDPYTELQNLRASASYWRQFIPRDGMLLSEAVAALPEAD